jgi:surface antigen
MRPVLIIAAVATCAACQPDPNDKQIALPAEQTQPACQDFSTPITSGGRPGQASGQACRHPDGSWRVVQNTPGLPAQDYVVPAPGQPPAAASTAVQPAPNQPPCSNYTVPVTVGGQQQEAVVEACPQPDGSWRIIQTTPGLPQQVYAIAPPAASPYPYSSGYPADYAYPDVFPYWAGSPWLFGLAPSIVVVQRFNHFNHGFGRGFGHGFGRGFGHGFGHGFAAAHGGGHR